MVDSNFTAVCRAAEELQNEAKAHVLHHVNVVTLCAMIFEPGHYVLCWSLFLMALLKTSFRNTRCFITIRVLYLYVKLLAMHVYTVSQITICILASV